MKIFSQMQKSPHGDLMFVMYLDTERTGKPAEDTVYSAFVANDFVKETDPDKILNALIPSLSELIYAVYGERPEYMNKTEPLTEYSRTGFDPNCINGVKGCEIK